MSENPRPRLGIVVINWNTGTQLQKCLSSIAATDQTAFTLEKIVVIDNGSSDGSMDLIESGDLPLEIIHNDHNRGFAAAVNQGAAKLSSDLLLLLNPDCQIAREALCTAVRALHDPGRSPPVGVVGARLTSESGRTSRDCARRPRPIVFWCMIVGLHRALPGLGLGLVMDDWDHESSRDVDHVMGAFYLMPLDLFRALGGLDERFFVYLEDLDLSVRVAEAGRPIRYVAEAEVLHLGGGASRQAMSARLAYVLESRIRYGFKHFRRAQAVALAFATLSIEPMIRVLYALARGSFREVDHTLRGTGLLWFRLFVRPWFGMLDRAES